MKSEQKEKARGFVKEWIKEAIETGWSFASFAYANRENLQELAQDTTDILFEIYRLAKACEGVLPSPTTKSRAMVNEDEQREAQELIKEVRVYGVEE